jgi:hypothetical protein
VWFEGCLALAVLAVSSPAMLLHLSIARWVMFSVFRFADQFIVKVLLTEIRINS